MRPEQALYNLIKDHLPGHHQRIESIAGVGAPDIELCYEGKSCWIELKCPPKIMAPTDMLRPAQQVWHFKRVQNKGLVFLIYRYSNTVYLIKAVIIKSTIGDMLSYKSIWNGSKPWHWEDFFANLVGELK